MPSDAKPGGVLIAWDPVTQKERWRKEGGGSQGGGTLTTATNLLLQVLPDGRLIVYSADTGEQLHEINTGLRLGMGPPTTYMVDGRQYVTLIGGRGVVVPPPAPAGGAAAGDPPTTMVNILDKPRPQYTAEGRNLRLEGDVVLDMVFQADGTVQVNGVISGLGHGLDEAAVRAAQQIKFKPAKRDGQPINFPARVRIEFRLAY